MFREYTNLRNTRFLNTPVMDIYDPIVNMRLKPPTTEDEVKPRRTSGGVNLSVDGFGHRSSGICCVQPSVQFCGSVLIQVSCFPIVDHDSATGLTLVVALKVRSEETMMRVSSEMRG